MRKILCLTAALLVAGTAMAAGEVWRWKDANGTWHYSDQPQPGAELVRRSSGRPATETAPAAAPAPTPQPAPSNATSTAQSPVSPEVAAQVRQEAATAKADQCKKAEETYQQVIKARVVTKTDAAGNKTSLSNEEIDAARLQARSVRDTACGPGA